MEADTRTVMMTLPVPRRRLIGEYDGVRIYADPSVPKGYAWFEYGDDHLTGCLLPFTSPG